MEDNHYWEQKAALKKKIDDLKPDILLKILKESKTKRNPMVKHWKGSGSKNIQTMHNLIAIEDPELYDLINEMQENPYFPERAINDLIKKHDPFFGGYGSQVANCSLYVAAKLYQIFFKQQ